MLALLLAAAAAGGYIGICNTEQSGILYGEAETENWYVNNRKISVAGKNYTKYGLGRVLVPSEISFLARYRGVKVYAERGGSGREIVYVLHGPARHTAATGEVGCVYQPYKVQPTVRRRR